jgi:hypothetical protein
MKVESNCIPKDKFKNNRRVNNRIIANGPATPLYTFNNASKGLCVQKCPNKKQSRQYWMLINPARSNPTSNEIKTITLCLELCCLFIFVVT